jgi:hypothetical protein
MGSSTHCSIGKNLPMCEEHIINPLQHRKEHIWAVKTEDSIKLNISGSTKTSDQCLPIDR